MQAMIDEIIALQHSGTWDLVSLLQGKQLLVVHGYKP